MRFTARNFYFRFIPFGGDYPSAVTIETFEEFAKRVLRERIEYSSLSYAETAEAVAQYVRKAVGKTSSFRA